MAPAPRIMNPQRNLLHQSTKVRRQRRRVASAKACESHVLKGPMGLLVSPYHHALATRQAKFAPPLDIECFRTLFARKLKVALSILHVGRA